MNAEVLKMQDPTKALPSPQQTIEFLEKGGSFALLCVLVIGFGIVVFFGGRAMFSLLREFLGKLNAQLEAQTKLLTDLHSEAKAQREAAEATSAIVIPWGSPEWLRSHLTLLERRSDEIKLAISEMRLELARVSPTVLASTTRGDPK